MVDIHRPGPMPSTLPPAHYCQNSYLPHLRAIEGPVLGDRKASVAGGHRHNGPQHSLPAADIRHGLRTPPGDMSGTSVNPLLAPNFGASQYKSVPAAVWHGATRQGSVGSLVNTRSTENAHPSQTIFHSRSRSHENTATQHNGLKESASKARDENHDSSIVSYLQIPSSINGSKGSLAEFAAQVCEACMEESLQRLISPRSPACSGLNPPLHCSTSKNARSHQPLSNRSFQRLYRRWDSENGSCRYCRPHRFPRMSYCWL